jgi:hypothetical protein
MFHCRERSLELLRDYWSTHRNPVLIFPAEEFIRRFLQRVLPDRFIKLRYYGLMSPGNRKLLNQARESLGAGVVESNPTDTDPDEQKRNPVPCCPCCGTVLTLVRELKRRRLTALWIRVTQSAARSSGPPSPRVAPEPSTPTARPR